jgi:hypothetical protein
MSFVNLKVIREIFNENFINDRRDAVCWYWHQSNKEFYWGNKTEMSNEFKSLKKQGCYSIQKNNRDYKDKFGVEWYSITIQQKGHNAIDTGTLAVNGFMVSGCVYWFYNKTNRDAMSKWFSKK